MRRNRYTGHTYGQKGGEGPNKGKVRATYQAQDPDGVWHKASMMVNPNEGVPKLAYMRFLPNYLDALHHTREGKPTWIASGVRPEPQLDWGGVWKPAERLL